MNNAYQKWLAGEGCCNAHNFINIETPDCDKHDVCDCENILLEISKLHTDDEILQEEIDAISGGSGITIDAYTKEEADERFQPIGDYLTEHQPLKTINGNVISGTGNIEITCSGGSVTVDDHLDSVSTNPAQNKVITEALNSKLDASAYTPTDLSNYVTISELNQNIINLQEQINSLISSISVCCGETGETQYRWVTMTGENDYWCSGTTKMSKEKEQESTDGINWVDVSPAVIRNGSTVLEYNCVECGYSGGSSIQLTYITTSPTTKIANICSPDVERIDIASIPNPITYDNCITTYSGSLVSGNVVFTYKTSTVVGDGEYANTDMERGGLSSEITSVGNGSFSGNTSLSALSIGSYSRLEPYNQDPDSHLTSIGDYAFKNCSNLKIFGVNRCKTSVPTLGTGAFEGCNNLNVIYVDASMENAFKTAPGWSDYSSIIRGI